MVVIIVSCVSHSIKSKFYVAEMEHRSVKKAGIEVQEIKGLFVFSTL